MIENRIQRTEHGHFAPSVSANPGGKPKNEYSIAKQIEVALTKASRDGDGARVQRIIERIADRAETGDLEQPVTRWACEYVRPFLEKILAAARFLLVESGLPTDLVFHVGVRRIGEGDDGDGDGDSDSADRD